MPFAKKWHPWKSQESNLKINSSHGNKKIHTMIWILISNTKFYNFFTTHMYVSPMLFWWKNKDQNNKLIFINTDRQPTSNFIIQMGMELIKYLI